MTTRNDFVHLLLSQLGYHEGHNASEGWDNIQKYSEQTPGFAWSDGQPWCATFECWGAWKNGMTGFWPMTASCAAAVDWWKAHGRFSEYPVLGGPLYMGAGGGDHTEVVISYTADTVTSVGGNTNDSGSFQGDGVYQHTRPRRGSGSPYGYGVPAFPEGTISADPALGGTASAAVPAPAPPAKPRVSLANVVAAAKADPKGAQGHQTHAADVRIVEVALHAGGYLAESFATDGSFGSKTVAAYAAWQRAYSKAHKLGWSGSDVNGIPGKTSLAALGAEHGFSVGA